MSRRSGGTGSGPRRRDRLIREYEHDTYKAPGRLPDPTACPDCGATFLKGRWTWKAAPVGAHEAPCPACHRTRDRFPAGTVTLSGPFLAEHRDEILGLVRNHEEREKKQHPLQRIMQIETDPEGVKITTTGTNLARGIGQALYRAYAGELDYHYADEERSLRVHWRR
jgi:NMD protein affecting ribosome stability and mRNA decay